MRKISRTQILPDEISATAYVRNFLKWSPHDQAIFVYKSHMEPVNPRRVFYDPWRKSPWALIHRAAVVSPPLFGLAVYGLTSLAFFLAGAPLALIAGVTPMVGLVAFGMGAVMRVPVSPEVFYAYAGYSRALRKGRGENSVSFLERRRKLRTLRNTLAQQLYPGSSTDLPSGHSELVPEAAAFIPEQPREEPLTMEFKAADGHRGTWTWTAVGRGERILGVCSGQWNFGRAPRSYLVTLPCCGPYVPVTLTLAGPRCACGATVQFATLALNDGETLANVLSEYLHIDSLEATLATNEIDRLLFR